MVGQEGKGVPGSSPKNRIPRGRIPSLTFPHNLVPVPPNFPPKNRISPGRILSGGFYNRFLVFPNLPTSQEIPGKSISGEGEGGKIPSPIWSAPFRPTMSSAINQHVLRNTDNIS